MYTSKHTKNTLFITMKMNPKIALKPDDLKGLEYKKVKALVKKDLIRLEKNTSAEKPTAVMLSGEFAYADKPAGIGFVLFGAWKGAFKNYAKNDVAKNDSLGAIGQAYFGGIGEDGQKVVRIDLAKGKAKGKTDKLVKGLKKLVPQATYNLVFGEMSDQALDALEKKIDSLPEIDEVFEDVSEEDMSSEVEISIDQSYQLILDSNLVELSQNLKIITTEVYPRLRNKTPQEGDADMVVDTLDLANEWMELYKESPEETRQVPKNIQGLTKVQNIQLQLIPMLPLLNSMGVKPSGATPPPPGGLPNVLRPDEKPAPGLDVGLSEQAIKKMFKPQGRKNNCNVAAKYMIYAYLQERGIMQIDTEGMFAPESNKAEGIFKGGMQLYDAALEKKVTGNANFKLGSGLGLKILQEDTDSDGYIPDANYKKHLAYIDSCLERGLPVYAGVTHTHEKDKGNVNDKTVDHFIVLIGKKGSAYCYLDPANRNGNDIANNLLVPTDEADYIFHDPNSPMKGRYYIIATVGQYKGDASSNKKSSEPLGTEISTTLKKGMNSDDVKILQTALNNLSATYKLTVDGDFGKKTHNAVLDVQTKNSIEATGIVAPNSPTWLAISGKKADTNSANTLQPNQITFQYRGGAGTMNAKADAVIRDILAKANEPNAIIVATFRLPQQQASVMLLNIERIGSKANRKMYRDKAAAAKVIDAYDKAVAANKTREQILADMVAVGGFDKISEHCDATNPAIDIHPDSIKNKSTFEAVLKADSRVSVVCPPNDTTYHIKVK